MNLMIGGASAHYKHLSLFFVKNKQKIKNIKITVYDGISNCSWNGGRINRDLELTDIQIKTYYSMNINIALTFSNPEIDLKDAVGNKLLKKFHKEGNSIILINDELRKYIREKYPKYNLIFSVTGTGIMNVPMNDSDVGIYKSLESKYDLIVPRMEHIFEPFFLSLNQNKYEIMLNDTCIYNCPYYKEHFEQIANQNKILSPWKVNPQRSFEIEECWIKGFNPDIGDIKAMEKFGDSYGMDIKKPQMLKLFKRGISNFKIIGRENPPEELLNELNTYIKDINEKNTSI